jgi:hypothetical protein
MTHDYSHFPGGENPLLHRDVMTTENTDGLMAFDTLGYPAPQYDNQSTQPQSLDQHDSSDHPGVDTPSGLDHVNPRGQIATDGVLNVPESSVGSVNLEDAIARIMARNLSKIVVRAENPGTALYRTQVLDAVSAQRIGVQDDMRAAFTVWSTNGTVLITGSIGDALAGNGALIGVGAMAIRFTNQADIWVIGSGGAATVNYCVERWEQN